MNRLFWIIITAIALQSCKEHTGYVIKGELADAEGMKIVLKKISADADEPVDMDSCYVKKGKFAMKGMVDYPEYCLLYVGDNGPIRLFVENSIIDISFHLNKIQDTEVTGSLETDLLREIYAQMAALGDSALKVNNEYMAFKQSEETDIEKEKNYLSRMDTIRLQRIEYAKQFITEHPNRIVTALILRSYMANVLPDELELYVNDFDDVNSQSPWVQFIKEKVALSRRLAIGEIFIDLTMNSPEGNEISLSEHAGKDKYVLIDFWASWCRPCRMDNPKLVKIYRKFKDKGFEIVGVSLDRDKTEWAKAIKADELEWVHISDLMFWQSQGVKLYMVNSIPYSVLLDKNGMIIDKGLKTDELEKKLADLLDTKE